MQAIVKMKLQGDEYVSTYILNTDPMVDFNNQRPGGKDFNWIGTINGIEVKISNGRRYSSQLDIDPALNKYRHEIADAISIALKEWD